MLHPTDVGRTGGPKVTALLVPVLLYHLEQTVINVNKSDTFYSEFRYNRAEYSGQNTYRQVAVAFGKVLMEIQFMPLKP